MTINRYIKIEYIHIIIYMKTTLVIGLFLVVYSIAIEVRRKHSDAPP